MCSASDEAHFIDAKILSKTEVKNRRIFLFLCLLLSSPPPIDSMPPLHIHRGNDMGGWLLHDMGG